MNISDARALPGAGARDLDYGQRVQPAPAAGAPRPRLLARRRAQGRRTGRHHQLYLLEEPLWRRSERARHAGAHERPAGDDRRRHARRHAVSRTTRRCGRPRFLPQRRKQGMRARSASSGGWPTRRPAAEAQTEMDGIAKRLAAAYPDAYKNLFGIRVETFTERFVGGAAQDDVSRHDGRGRLRAAHRLRERGQPAALALGEPGARDRRSHRARRHPLARRPTAAGREPGAGLRGRDARAAARVLRRARIRRARSAIPESRTGSTSASTTSCSDTSPRSAR